MLKRVGIRELFNQTFAIDAGSSHIVVSAGENAPLVREPTLIALAVRKGPPVKRHRRGAPPPTQPQEEQVRVLSVGREASRPPPLEEQTVRLVYPVDHGRIVDLDALELVLRKAIAQLPVKSLHKMLFGLRMKLLRPLHLGEEDVTRFQELLRDFGFNRIRLLDGPVAAARGAGVDAERSHGQMLIDIGGGQTTIAVFAIGSIAAWHWSPVGGRALDDAVIAYVEWRHRIRLRPTAAEDLKCRLGSVYPRERPQSVEIRGFDTSTGIEKKVTLDDNDLRDVLIDGCEPLVMAVQQGFDDVPPELAADIAQGEIVLVGGGALLAGLPEFLAERTGLRFRVAADPINAAMRGVWSMEPE